VDDIGCTSKTMPKFEHLWTAMINDSVPESEGETISR
jgi:hypothetical protein